MRKPLFISFEGADGSGKTTQIKLLDKKLREKGIGTAITREPGGAPVSDKIRALLLDNGSGKIDFRAEALLYAADRAEHVAKVIGPALKEGKVVITDRYIDSSLAYQGIVRGLGIERIFDINVFATGGLMPDITFLLHLKSVEARLKEREQPLDRIESEGVRFQEKVIDAYLELAKKFRERFVIVDAKDEVEKISMEIVSIVFARMKE